MPMIAPAASIISSPFELAVQSVNTNPIFIGVMMLCMNLGGRFLPFEISKGQEAVLQHPYFRRFMIFVILFIATRNVVTAFWLAIILILCIGYFFNETSSLCVLKGGVKGSTCSTKNEGFVSDTNKVLELTPEERDILNRLREKERKIAAITNEVTYTNNTSIVDKYRDAMNIIKNN